MIANGPFLFIPHNGSRWLWAMVHGDEVRFFKLDGSFIPTSGWGRNRVSLVRVRGAETLGTFIPMEARFGPGTIDYEKTSHRSVDHSGVHSAGGRDKPDLDGINKSKRRERLQDIPLSRNGSVHALDASNGHKRDIRPGRDADPAVVLRGLERGRGLGSE